MTTLAAARAHSQSPSAFASQYNVFKALILRDIRTRFFGNGLGYIVAICWPLTHILILLGIYLMAGRTSPVGGSVTLFLAIAVTPVINYQYMSRFISMSVLMNKPLLGLPPVKPLDLIIARGILEAACAVCVAFVFFCIIYFIDVEISPNSTTQLAYAFLSNLFLAFGVGSLVGVFMMKVPGLLLFLVLFNIILYITAGVVFMPSSMPEPILYVLSFNPVLHSVEWFREAYYVNYTSPVLDKSYLLSVGATCLISALVIDRAFRRFLTQVS